MTMHSSLRVRNRERREALALIHHREWGGLHMGNQFLFGGHGHCVSRRPNGSWIYKSAAANASKENLCRLLHERYHLLRQPLEESHVLSPSVNLLLYSID